MTDQADTPDPIGLAGITTPLNPHEVAVVEAASRTLVALAAEVWALRTENDVLQERVVFQGDEMRRLATDVGARVGVLRRARAERDSALAELAAARDREAVVRAAIEDVATFIPHARNFVQIMETSLYGAEITMRDRIAARLAAALSQSEPTKGASE